MRKAVNARQERFCEFVAAGESQTDAYIKAGYKVSKDDARKHASRMMTNDGVKAHIAALRAPQTRKALLSKERKRELLRDIAEDASRPSDSRIRAIAEDNKMAGHNQPDHHIVETSNKTLESIQERARRIASLMSIAPPECQIPHQ